MGHSQAILRRQDNPDGEEGHAERQRFDKESKEGPKKKNFTHGMMRRHTPITKADQRALDIEVMKSRCDVYTNDCQITSCHNCKRKERLIEKERAESALNLKRIFVRDCDRPERQIYFSARIAFDCPITGKRHAIVDCFRFCNLWGRVFSAHFMGEQISILNCSVSKGKKELHSGNSTEPEE